MLIANLRTPVGLVNGAIGKVVAVELRDSGSGVVSDTDMRSAVSAAGVRYVVVDFPKYSGPAMWPDHPTWVPVEPLLSRMKRKLFLMTLDVLGPNYKLLAISTQRFRRSR